MSLKPRNDTNPNLTTLPDGVQIVAAKSAGAIRPIADELFTEIFPRFLADAPSLEFVSVDCRNPALLQMSCRRR